MPLDQILRNMSIFVDGVGKLGICEEFNPPDLKLVAEEYRGAGMDAAIKLDHGYEALECSFMVTSFDRGVYETWGRRPGVLTALTARGALVSEAGAVTGTVLNMRGMVETLEHEAWKPGEKGGLTITLALRYFKRTDGGRVVTELDPENLVRIIGGVDQTVRQRDVLGL